MTGEKIILRLTEADYLNYQLFHASQSQQIKKARKKVRWLLLGIVLLTAFALYQFNTQWELVMGYAVGGVVLAAIYPWYQKVMYSRYYRKFVQENYRNLIGRDTELTIGGHELTLKDVDSETRIQFSRIEKIFEVPETFYIKLNTASSVIIPKSQLQNVDAMRKLLQDIASQTQIPFEHLPDWKWK